MWGRCTSLLSPELLAAIRELFGVPAILQPNDFGLWLSHNMHDTELLRDMYQPFPAELLEAYRVSDMVNSVRFDSPACIARV